MSYGVMPYAVDLEGIRRFGSYDAEFADETLARMSAYALRKLDVSEDFDIEIGPKELLRQLLCGEPAREGIGFAYGYALEAFCATYGDILTNRGWSGMRYGYFEVVESALSELGVSFDPASLTYGGVPGPMPRIDDFPCIGSLDVDEIDTLAGIFDAVDLGRLTDVGIRESVGEIGDWLRYCRQRRVGLVCFYY